MDIKSIASTDGQQERERQAIILLEKLIKQNSDYGASATTDIDAAQHFEKNLRDAKNLQRIMEKFKIDSADSLIEDNYKDG